MSSAREVSTKRCDFSGLKLYMMFENCHISIDFQLKYIYNPFHNPLQSLQPFETSMDELKSVHTRPGSSVKSDPVMDENRLCPSVLGDV